MIDPGELVSETLKREFGEEAMNSLEAGSVEKAKLKNEVAEFFKNGSEVCGTSVCSSCINMFCCNSSHMVSAELLL